MNGDKTAVAFSFICNEDWDRMALAENGRHCVKCNKTVVDFTKDTTIDIIEERRRAGGELCGRFKRSQTVYGKIAASLLFTAGLGLANANAQVPEGMVEPPPPTFSNTTEVENVTLPDVFFGQVVESYPIYKGGDEALLKFLAENIKYPQEQVVNGVVYAGFTIDTLGNTKDIKILRGLSPAANNEVIRVVALLKFIPGTQNGKVVEVRYTLPIKFTMRDKDK